MGIMEKMKERRARSRNLSKVPEKKLHFFSENKKVHSRNKGFCNFFGIFAKSPGKTPFGGGNWPRPSPMHGEIDKFPRRRLKGIFLAPDADHP
jgi:hypothetical protein